MLANIWIAWKRWRERKPPIPNNYPHEPERLAYHLDKVNRAVEWERIRNAS